MLIKKIWHCKCVFPLIFHFSCKIVVKIFYSLNNRLITRKLLNYVLTIYIKETDYSYVYLLKTI